MKHKVTKRVLGLLMAMVMLVGLLPTAAIPGFAALKDPVVTSLAFKTKPQNGTAIKTDGYPIAWLFNKTPDLAILEIREINRLTGATTWKQLSTLSGISGSMTLPYPTLATQRTNDESVYRISAAIAGATTAENELATCTFTVTWVEGEARTLTVNEGSGSGAHDAGKAVTVTANANTVDRVFVGWSGLDGLTVITGSVTSTSVTFLMPNNDLELTALYRRVKQEITPARPAKGDGTEEHPFEIGSVFELYWFAGFVNGTIEKPADITVKPEEAHAKLTNDITVNSNLLTDEYALNANEEELSLLTQWLPINEYSGTFDGQGYAISGIYCAPQVADYRYYGFFGKLVRKGFTTDACIRNLTLEDSYFCAPTQSSVDMGALVGSVSSATVKNCHFNGIVTTAITADNTGSRIIAGIAGYVNGEIRNCTTRGVISGYGYQMGGITAMMYSGEISGCVNEAIVENATPSMYTSFTGGIVADMYLGTVQDCCNKGDVIGNDDTGGIVSRAQDSTVTILRCRNEGAATNGAGIVCWLSGTIQNCYNAGTVKCGIVLQANSDSSVTYCHNVGEIDSSYSSPVCDYADARAKIANCYYMADSELDEIDGTTYKTADQFADGTVLALLESGDNAGNWAQGDGYPVLAKPTGDVCGTIKSFGSESDDITIKLYAEGSETASYTATVKSNSTSFTIEKVNVGSYTVVVQKKGHVAQQFTLAVASENAELDITLLLKGDVTTDGAVSIADVAAILDLLAGKSEPPEGVLTDLNDDDALSIADVAALLDVLAGKAEF